MFGSSDRATVLQYFPDLPTEDFEITSPSVFDYNCIAWAAGDTSRCWWPFGGYWPISERSLAIKTFVAAFEPLGYYECENDHLENGFEKIAIYASITNEPTHMARQLSDGTWTSKLGNLYDIAHNFANSMSGKEYGNVVLYMKREIGRQEHFIICLFLVLLRYQN